MREPDPQFQDLLADAGGTNTYGDPMFRFAWSKTERRCISNGRWYQDFPLCLEPCWMLMKWEPADFWGSKPEWDFVNRESSVLKTAGEYPSEGRYRMLQKLLTAKVSNNFLTYHPLELSTNLVTQILPMLKAFLELTPAAKVKLLAGREAEEKNKLAKQFARSRDSYRGQADRRIVQARTESLEKYMGDRDWQRRVLNQTSSGKRRIN